MDDNAGDSTGNNASNSRARGEPFGRAPRSARSVAAGYRTFRRRCRLSTRQKITRFTFGSLFGQYSFFHQSCATGTLLLQKEIYPQKSLPNLRQLTFCRLLNGSACCSRQARYYRHFNMPAEITARSKVGFSRVARLFDTFGRTRRWQITH